MTPAGAVPSERSCDSEVPGANPEEMTVDWDVPIVMDDGVELRCDVFRPVTPEAYPVLISCGPYGKGLAFQTGRAEAWAELVEKRPEVLVGSSNRYQCWEMPDPERFVPHGYVCVRIDSRGAGRSGGVLDPLSPREIRDLYDCIEWAARASWSSGRVGLLGVSYLAINQWLVAALAPPSLRAICPWEGGADFYRDLTRHGGILSSFWASWYERRVLPVQHGMGERGPRSDVTGDTVAGPATLDDRELATRRVDLIAELRAHDLDDGFHRARTPDWTKVRVPFLSAANWGGHGLHARGNFEAFTEAAATHKWLEVHGGSHFEEFSSDAGVELQRRFFDRFLKGDAERPDGGSFGEDWRVLLQVRHIDGFVERREQEWPLARTRWTKAYLDLGQRSLVGDPPVGERSLAYDALGNGVTLLADPVDRPTEVTGPLAARLHVSTTAHDADLFLVVRAFDPAGREVLFRGAQDDGAPLAQGWLRLSHRLTDAQRSMAWRPYHGHDTLAPVVAGEVYAVDVEVWPTSIVLPPGHRLALSVRGRDFQRDEPEEARGVAVRVMNGSGRCVHDDPLDRGEPHLSGQIMLHQSPARASYLLIPFVD